MIFAIRLSCILVVVFCLASSGRAGTPAQDRNRLQQLQRLSQRTTNSNAQLRITHEVVQIYKRYRGRMAAGARVEARLNNKVRDFESKIVLVDGVPAQGGAFWETLKGAGSQIPDEVWTNAQNLFKTSSKTLVEGIANYLMTLLMQSLGVGRNK